VKEDMRILAKYKDGTVKISRRTDKGKTIEELVYSRRALRAAWKSKTDINKHARRRKYGCVVFPVPNEETALKLSSLFTWWILDSPDAVHYDGKTISFFCGDLKKGKEAMLNCIELPALLEEDIRNNVYFFSEDLYIGT
jgi:hypothetical protein